MIIFIGNIIKNNVDRYLDKEVKFYITPDTDPSQNLLSILITDIGYEEMLEYLYKNRLVRKELDKMDTFSQEYIDCQNKFTPAFPECYPKLEFFQRMELYGDEIEKYLNNLHEKLEDKGIILDIEYNQYYDGINIQLKL